jgi:hypothetical protein
MDEVPGSGEEVGPGEEGTAESLVRLNLQFAVPLVWGHNLGVGSTCLANVKGLTTSPASLT